MAYVQVATILRQLKASSCNTHQSDSHTTQATMTIGTVGLEDALALGDVGGVSCELCDGVSASHPTSGLRIWGQGQPSPQET